MLYASPRNFALPLMFFIATMSSVWAAESPRQAPLELPKEFMPAEVSSAKKPMSKSIKLVKADMAQDPVPAASSAVAKPVAPVGKPLPEEMVAPVWKTHTVVAGDTLEKLVKKYYVNSPLKPEVLRDWVVVNNPKAFTKVNTKKLQPGTVLNFADQAELIQKLMPSAVSKANVEPNSPPVNPLPPPVGGAAAHQGGNFQALVEPNKRNWVRFP
jgi:LysM repeat protein